MAGAPRAGRADRGGEAASEQKPGVRRQFPLLADVVWLHSAGVGPMSRRALDAVDRVQASMYRRLEPEAWEQDPQQESRRRLAQLLCVDPDEVALVCSTSEGLNALAGSLTWRPGERIVLADQEYPANVVPWYHQAHRHRLQVSVVRSRDGRLTVEDFARVVDSRTRVVAVSHVQFASGCRLDLAALAELAHRHGALLVADGIQAVGAVAVRPRDLGVDAVACGGYKWLCGPLGTGFLYVRRELADRLTPAVAGFEQIGPAEHQAVWDDLCSGAPWVRDFTTLAPGAPRFDGVGLSPALFAGLAAAVEQQLEFDPHWIERRIRALTGRLIAGLGRRGYRVVTPTAEEARAGIVLFRGPWDLSSTAGREELENGLLAQGVRVSVRAGGVRAACHFFNTEDDLGRLFAALRAV
ncbi:MAG: aminotransferase class V-fold PLP-dependent enzyme [Candidatus Bipolaricaulaceae bacterium]